MKRQKFAQRYFSDDIWLGLVLFLSNQDLINIVLNLVYIGNIQGQRTLLCGN